MPNSVLNQLKALRDGVAQDLRKDPRYLTLQALDKSIEEISAMLASAGLIPATAPTPSLTQRLSGLAPQPSSHAEPTAVLGTDTKAPASPEHNEAPARSTLGFKDGTASFPHPAVPHHVLPPFSNPAVAATGAVAAVAGAAAFFHEHRPPETETGFEFSPEDDAGEYQAAGDEAEQPEHHGADLAHDEHVAADHFADKSEAGEIAAASVPASSEPETEAHFEEAREIKAEASVHPALIETAEAPALAHDDAIEPAGETAAHNDHNDHEAGIPDAIHAASDEVHPDELRTAISLAGQPIEEPLEAEQSLAAHAAGMAPLLEEGAHEAIEPEAAVLDSSHQPALPHEAEHRHEEEAAPREEDALHDGAATANASALSAVAAALLLEETDHAQAHESSADEPEAAAEETPAHAAVEPAHQDHLTADLEAALEEMVAGTAAAEPVSHDGVSTAIEHSEAAEPEAHTPEPAGLSEAEHALDMHSEAHAGEAHAETGDPEFGDIAAGAIAAALFPEEEPAAAHHLETEAPEAAKDDGLEGGDSETEHPAFAAIGAGAIAAALFPDEASHEEASEPAASQETGSEPRAETQAKEHEPVFETAAPGALAATLFPDDHEDLTASAETASVFPEGKGSGYVPLAAKPGVPQYSPSIAVKFGKLPARVDLRPLLAPIEDQGAINSGVASAAASAYEYWIRKATKKPQNISRPFVYYNARWRAGTQDSDGGSTIQFTLEGLQKFGACQEAAWPSNPALLTKRPGAEAYRDAAPYRVHDMAQVPLKLEAWKQALAEGKPVIFALVLFDSFATCADHGGVVPMPAPDDVEHKAHRMHAMCAVGYSDVEKVFIVRNSWGESFGDKGYCYIPFNYLLNPKFNDGDNWIFVPKVPSQPPRETWQDTAAPVTNGGQGVDFPIEPYRIEDYVSVSGGLFEHARGPWNPETAEDYSDYAGKVSKSLFDELESFDVTSLITSPEETGATAEDAPLEIAGGAVKAGDDDEWGNAAAWGVSTAVDHSRGAGTHEEKAANGTADAELTHSLP